VLFLDELPDISMRDREVLRELGVLAYNYVLEVGMTEIVFIVEEAPGQAVRCHL